MDNGGYFTVKNWFRTGLLNLSIVAALGLLMRLKVLFPLPLVQQKFVLHAHSHFAFSGWISHALMLLTVVVLFRKQWDQPLPKVYERLLLINLLAAYGMLASFFIGGYNPYSIGASSLAVLISYIYAWLFRKDLSVLSDRHSGVYWLHGALFFLVISSIGTFLLAWLMMTHHPDSRFQLASVYFYLHFQYNGWFFFACMGLVHFWLKASEMYIPNEKPVYRLFVLSCIPAYFLSALWLPIPGWLYSVIVVATMAQTAGWLIWIRGIFMQRKLLASRLNPVARRLFYCAMLAITIKIGLQALSVIPELSKLAFSFRPVVIGYLHLVLLGGITLFILGYGFQIRMLNGSKSTVIALWVFVAGIVLNEMILMAQGLSGILRIYIDHLPVVLGVAAVMMLTGISWLTFIRCKK